MTLSSPDAPMIVPLVIRFGRLGDMVLQTPLMHLLHRRYGCPCILLTSGQWASALFARSQDVGAIWQLNGRHTPFLLSPERWRLVAALRRHHGPIYVSEDSDRQLPKIRRLLALAGIGGERCVFLNEAPALKDEHWVDQLLRFGRLTPSAFREHEYVVSEDDHLTAPRLETYPSDRADCETWLRQRGFGSNRPLILLQPGNKRAMKWGRRRQEDTKAWPIERWVGLMRAMHQQLPSATLLLCGSPAERSLLREIRDASKLRDAAIAAKDLPLRRFIGLLEIAHSMVSVDTGPAHMAAAVGCPLVVLYGSESPLRWSRRRNSVTRRVIELGGYPRHTSVGEIQLDKVVDAWSNLKGLATTDPNLCERNHQVEISMRRDKEDWLSNNY